MAIAISPSSPLTWPDYLSVCASICLSLSLSASLCLLLSLAFLSVSTSLCKCSAGLPSANLFAVRVLA